MRFLFGDCAIDTDRRELCCGVELVAVEPQVFDLLVHVIRNRDHVVSKDDLLAAVWNGRNVSESTLGNRINAARRAIGDSGEQQKFIRTVARRGIRFVGEVREESSDSGRPGSAAPSPETPRLHIAPAPMPPQEVTFCRTTDGVNLAVATTGNGLPVVKTANWLNHIEHDWNSPVWSPLFARLSAQFRLIRYDERGSGLSDWNIPDLSLDMFVRDLETVVDMLGLGRFALLGISRGAPISIAYAARHPDRVSRLVLCGGYARCWRSGGDPAEIAQREALITLMQGGWGRDNPAFRQVFTSLFVPGATPQQMQWFNDLQRVSTSPENAARLFRFFAEIDITDLLPQIAVPTLVLHSRGDAPIPFEQGLTLARGIPNARLVALESNNHLILAHEPEWQRYIDEICGFLDEKGEGRSRFVSSPGKREPKTAER
jgi:pimeloyl-ACP methyl ester carboxylesterase/DNA-binding winged helix-turn-helix (wHTH) protein